MQKTDFKRFGLMMDMSRNSVMNLPQLKVFTKEIASMGYNMLMLYTEDTYEVKKYPQMGYQRGRYTKAELAEIEQALYGDAATDYERVAALDARKSEIEEQLLADYEELEELEA